MNGQASPSPPAPGTSLTTHSLYHTLTPSGATAWLTTPPSPPPPTSLSRPASEPAHALTLRHRAYPPDSGNYALDSIVIRHPALVKVLGEVIPNVGASYEEEEQGIVMGAPFRHLFWHLGGIEAAGKAADEKGMGEGPKEGPREKEEEEEDGKAAAAIQLLLDVLYGEFRGLLARQRAMVKAGEINFETLWTLYRPGIACVKEFMGSVVGVEVLAIDYGRHAMGGMYYRVHYRQVVWLGDGVGWREGYTDILEYRGRRRIGLGALAVVPVKFWDGRIGGGDGNWGKGGLEGLGERGRRFLTLVVKEPYLVRFSGESLDTESTSMMWWQGEQTKKMSERVVLDAKAYNHYFRRLNGSKWKGKGELAEVEEELIYVFPELHAFALKHKRWTRLWIDDVEEVVFNELAYPSLVLPNDYKQLLLAFAEAHMEGYGGFDDVIAGKGQGILMLLAGPPGTGKTLTAEAMSEHMRRPLYSVSTGELGTGNNMEHELNKVLELSTRWNAVLLLDEADVFLEKRADNDIQRNSIVSVFLRRLEYYRGIMFLTTNRIRSFDEAFRSRIHVAIQYPDLDAAARKSIWSNFLEQSRKTYKYGVDISEEEVRELARAKTVNGREIRNLVKSAQLLASRGGEKLATKHVESVWRVEMENSPWKAAGQDQG